MGGCIASALTDVSAVEVVGCGPGDYRSKTKRNSGGGGDKVSHCG